MFGVYASSDIPSMMQLDTVNFYLGLAPKGNIEPSNLLFPATRPALFAPFFQEGNKMFSQKVPSVHTTPG
jgi:hypothetical protein